MTTSLTLDLAAVLEDKYPHGFHVPVQVELDRRARERDSHEQLQPNGGRS